MTHRPATTALGTAPDAAVSRRPVNWRSVSLGLLGVVVIAALTPYNDWVAGNTSFIGSHLPTGVLLLLLSFIALINAPLRTLRPHLAMSSGELAVVLGMMLVGCALPNAGLMRYLPGNLTGLWKPAGGDAEIRGLLETLDLPDWMFPTFTTSQVGQRASDPVNAYFYNRTPFVESNFSSQIAAVPWRAWVTPFLTWGVFLVFLLGGVLCAMIILRRQWVENERLPFPLATVFLSLIEEPTPGRAFASLFRSRGFWIAFFSVFCIHLVNGVAEYWPRQMPKIPIAFDLSTMLAEEPWKYLEDEFKKARIYFTIIGLIFFIQTRVAFSLWFFFLAVQVARVVMGSTYQRELTDGMELDQSLGAIVPFSLAILWVARHHLTQVGRQMFRGPRAGDLPGRYLPYWLAGWGLVVCLGGQVAWLSVAGASLMGAIVIVGMLLLAYVVLARLVAETGIPYLWLPILLNRPWVFLGQTLPAAIAPQTTLRSHFLTNLVHGLFAHDFRETLPPYAMNAMRVADEAAYPQERSWRGALPFTLCLLAALGVSYVVSYHSMLYVEYNHGVTLSEKQESPINEWGAEGMSRWHIIPRTLDFAPPNDGPKEGHDRLFHFSIGAVLSTSLSVLRLRYDWWPIHPIGFLIVYTIGMRFIWFSVILGWLCKAMIVRFGGARLFREGRSFFMGLIIGEAAAIAFWLVTSLILLGAGWPYKPVQLLPS
jgi:hypothetical protein